MKSKFIILAFIALAMLIFNGCESGQSKERDFVLSEDSPATALTIGWYVPVKVVEQLAGKNYSPKIVQDDMSAIMLYIVKSEQHSLDGEAKGMMKAAHLVIPVEKPSGLKVDDADAIEATMSCPLNIIDVSNDLGDKYADHAFATYRGKIELCRSFPRFLLFVSFFPQLVAGPIVRASEFLPQLNHHIAHILQRPPDSAGKNNTHERREQNGQNQRSENKP